MGWSVEGFPSNFVGLGTFAWSFFIRQKDFVGKIRALLIYSKKKKSVLKQEAQEEKHIKSLNYHFRGISKLSKPFWSLSW